ncbi:MAG TPA: hypothetical protein VGB52_12000 [Actinomycetota bacterium]
MSVTIFRGAWFVLLAVYLILWARALVGITRTPDEEYRIGGQIGWAAVVVFVPVIGLLAYHLVGAPRRG